MKPKTYLFPGTVNNWLADVPIILKVVWKAVNESGKRTIQVLLGHAKIGDTALYLHLFRRHLQAVASPLEAIEVSSPDEVKRSRRTPAALISVYPAAGVTFWTETTVANLTINGLSIPPLRLRWIRIMWSSSPPPATTWR
jgi:hypothetical protein